MISVPACFNLDDMPSLFVVFDYCLEYYVTLLFRKQYERDVKSVEMYDLVDNLSFTFRMARIFSPSQLDHGYDISAIKKANCLTPIDAIIDYTVV